ncbi:hypothetical protein SASPL_129611 [Salvia splendens]|uniref:Uncharacterized protein n=1 Tax=Salvia splendens TaxID=180675 RepID=A0A8X8XGE7_SALSN|nr:hypothetical protein SASPL_129611 [Salvia splendens]
MVLKAAHYSRRPVLFTETECGNKRPRGATLHDRVMLRLDFNMLKALPEGIGKLERLEILTLHFNRALRQWEAGCKLQRT